MTIIIIEQSSLFTYVHVEEGIIIQYRESVIMDYKGMDAPLYTPAYTLSRMGVSTMIVVFPCGSSNLYPWLMQSPH